MIDVIVNHRSYSGPRLNKRAHAGLTLDSNIHSCIYFRYIQDCRRVEVDRSQPRLVSLEG